MKLKIILFLTVLAASVTLIAGETLLEYFNASSDGSTITVEWKSIDESDISYYVLERKSSNSDYSEINTETAKGYSFTYKYLDEEAFRDGDSHDNIQSQRTYHYRLIIHKKGNTTVDGGNATVSHSTSGIRKSWSMLKEMFR